MDMINLKINGMDVAVKAGSTILDAARQAGIKIPTLCYLREINAIGACRICVVEVKGARGLVTACVYPVEEGMEVLTNTERVLKARKTTLELILSNHDKRCLSCNRNQNCELQALSYEYGTDATKFEGENPDYKIDTSSPSIVRDNNKCILCRRCVAVCKQNQHVAVIGANDRGFNTHVGTAFEKEITSSPCVNCGQCTAVCPTNALREKDDTDKVWAALNNKDIHVVVAPAPAVRATLGECFGDPVGTNVTGKLAAVLRRLGFTKVFDIDLGADFTIMEEGTEFMQRLADKDAALPMITSCSPGWVKFCEHYYPEFIPNLSTCKSPQQMFGALIKTYYAEKMGIDPEKIYMVSVMPCTAKKFERTRPGQEENGIKDIDVVITTRELANMIKRAGIMWDILPDEEFDAPMGMSTGAAAIFGTTGGVMEAALRTVAEVITKKPLEKIEFDEVRGTEGIKEATYKLDGNEVKVAVASGLANASKLLDAVKSGEKKYHFIEIMACPGGCVNGGGQPIQPADVHNNTDVKGIRASALYSEDERLTLRKSHENTVMQKIYEEYLGKPGSHKAHELFHTHYEERSKY